MKLKEFVEKFICKNTLIRLWTPNKGGHELIQFKNCKDVCMEWELLEGDIWQSAYSDYEVIGITNVLCTGYDYGETVNIVINIDKPITDKTVTPLEDLIDWLRGERYGYFVRKNEWVNYGDLNDPINYDENKKQLEFGRNRMIEKTINKINELKGD